MLAQMDHGMGGKFLPQPEIEGQVMMRRRQIRGMVTRLGVDVIAACRLNREGHLPETPDRQGKGFLTRPIRKINFRIGPILNTKHGIITGLAPSCLNHAPDLFRQTGVMVLIPG